MNFFSYYRVWPTSGNDLSGSTRYYGDRFASYEIISVTPNRLLKTQIFEKKMLFFRRKVFSAYFFLRYRVKQTSGNKLEGSTMYSDRFWLSYKIFSLGPTWSMEKISQKKDVFPMKNKFCHFFLVLPSVADLR